MIELAIIPLAIAITSWVLYLWGIFYIKNKKK